MANITADKVLNKSLYAKGSVNVYDIPGGKIFRTISNGGLIGEVFSYVNYEGTIYWMFYNSYMRPFYVKHDPSNLNLPGLNDILAQIKNEKIAAEIESKGAVNYYLQKYLPYIIGAVVIAFVFPAVYKSVKK